MKNKAGDYMTFGERLAYARKKKGLLQKQLAKLIGVEQTSISAWEMGKYYPDESRRESVIQKIVEALEVSEDWLTGKSDNFSMKNLAENPRNIKLTKEQQQFVADNEYVIKAVFKARKYYLDGETYEDLYGNAAIALCMAAETYDETQYKGENSSFFKYAYYCVERAMSKSYWKIKSFYDRNISLNKKTGEYDDDEELGSLIQNPGDDFEQLEYKILLESVCQKVETVLSVKQREVFGLWLHGKSDMEIAKELIISPKAAASRKDKAKKKCRASFTPEEIFA